MSNLTAYDKFMQQALKYGFSLFGTAKTGQVIAYVEYDDGDWRRGYPRRGPRFTDNDDGTTTDNATGLMWVKDPSAAGLNAAIWSTALGDCQSLVYAGHNDWRMANIKEAISIVDYGKDTPAYDTAFFDFPATALWTSTSKNSNTAWAWTLAFINGIIEAIGKSINSRYPLVCRGGYGVSL